MCGVGGGGVLRDRQIDDAAKEPEEEGKKTPQQPDIPLKSVIESFSWHVPIAEPLTSFKYQPVNNVEIMK